MTDASSLFAQRYRNKSALELAQLTAEEDNLVPEAREALRVEITRRSQMSEQAPAHTQAAALADPSVTATDNLDGVRGWLFLYCLALIFASIRSTIATVVAIINGGIPLVVALLIMGVVGWEVVTAVAIFVRARSTLRIVFIQILLSGVAIVFLLGAQIASLLTSNESEKVLILKSVLGGAETLIWYRYFCVSKRVRITFGRNL